MSNGTDREDDGPDFTALQDRLEPGGGPGTRGSRAPLPIGKALAGLTAIGLAAALLGYGMSERRGDGEEPLTTAEPDDWQGTGPGFATMATPQAAPAPEPIPAATQPSQAPIPPPSPSATEQALRQTLDDLRAEVEALREAGKHQGAEPPDEASQEAIDSLTRQLATLSDEAEDLRAQVRDADVQARARDNEIRGLEARLEAAQFGDGTVSPLPPEGLETGPGTGGEAARLAALEERRARAEELRQARIESPMIAFGGSASPSNAAGAAGPSGLGSNEDFLRQGARRAEVEQASVIANPSRTVIQGTVIQAALETAIDSDLPGAIRAVVSEDVHSFDGTRVLIPRGSKLIGRCNSQIGATQRRLMIAWDRLLTPDGQSVTISAYGADELGRSGTTGRIDRRLGTRFGSAALVSLISALPSAAAASVEDPLAAELAEELGGDAEDASRSVLDDYLSVPPTIYIDQGARITVLVDRDLELLG
ncbi:TrbI/VirB10 family protein [Rubellimicrobium aerolatum]|uniref:TrbI/VirB10 family protein n=1 Tax=Rubellimicrobium aerolatum TaxID=490979 RepID=A0ABW0SEM4_9RHOB|nr:TrbI/VirB10 family protein [Rubellimicrobium aerolatum]MBP1806898.1 type IV secretion system protein VirB10 [Rubellimicrobium aerolatum]